jgi:UDP-GlcNAc:undecaprenyl-phosphate/decaprenyl-phosphate GlcNAc-1-phosphate transferase
MLSYLNTYPQNYWFFIFIIFIGSFSVTYIIIPKILWVVQTKNLATPINKRSSHNGIVASFGGVAFFISFLIVLNLLQLLHINILNANLILMGLTVLFVVGLKDDLVMSSPRVKLLGQLIAILLVLFIPEIHIGSAFGFLNIGNLYYGFSLAIAAFVVLGSINAYNLIDGIDGLAGIIGIIIFACYGLIFYLTQQYLYFYISLCGVAVLIAFLRYNLASGTKKIFMGDTGSLIIGYLIGILTLKFLAYNPMSYINVGFKPENSLILVLAILFIPIFDTARVIICRLLKGKSPFYADRDHSHHVLIDLGFSHLRASLVLGSLNIFVIVLLFLLGRYYNSFVLIVFTLMIYLLATYLIHALKTRIK